jgi:transposase
MFIKIVSYEQSDLTDSQWELIKGHFSVWRYGNRHRHPVVDTEGRCISKFTPRIRMTPLPEEIFSWKRRSPTLRGVCGDDGYRGTFVDFVTNTLCKTVEISKRISQTWIVIAKRWVVERTFSWLNSFRRLAKDCEILAKSEENIVINAHWRLQSDLSS